MSVSDCVRAGSSCSMSYPLSGGCGSTRPLGYVPADRVRASNGLFQPGLMIYSGQPAT